MEGRGRFSTLRNFRIVHMFGYSEQLDNCCEALVVQGSPAELNQPLISGTKKAGE